ncbi:MAG: PAS domain-containing protein [Lachnospiraceae bacterium]|nr:PAS domain-containing protein [Lachnospiraceae bacterium]
MDGKHTVNKLNPEEYSEELREQIDAINARIDEVNAVDRRHEDHMWRETMSIINDVVDAGFWCMRFGVDGNLKGIYWNDKMRRVMGYQDGEKLPELPEEWMKSVHPDDRESLEASVNECLYENKDLNINYRIHLRTGEYNLFKVHGKCMKYPNGKPRLFIGTFVNATVWEREKLDMNARLDAVLGGVNGGLKISRNELHYPYAYISESVARIQGYTPEELMEVSGGTAVGNGKPSDIKAIAGEMMHQFKETNSYSAKYRVRHKDGHWIWIQDYGKRVIAHDGQEYVYSLIQNVDEQEMLYNQLATERKQYKDALIKNSVLHFSVDLTDGYYREEIYDFTGKAIFATNKIQLPYSIDDNADIIKKYALVPLDEMAERAYHTQDMIQMYENGTSQFEYHVYNKLDDMYMRAICLLHKREEDDHVYANFIFYDETAEKLEEFEQRRVLETALAQAEYANKAKTMFLSSMSHDIRTPMNAIIGYTNLAEKSLGDIDKVGDYLSKIRTSSNHLLNLINDVLDMSRIESGKIRVEESENSLSETMNEVRTIVMNEARAKQLQMNFDISEVSDDFVWCDQLRLIQILLNCLSNSIKFTPVGGTIGLKIRQLSCGKSGYGNFEFVVYDNGIGMSEEFAKHIFEPFTRESTSTVSGIQGTGLGMSIAKNLVDMMGGSIAVSSKRGKGTEVIISLTLKLCDNIMREGIDTELSVESQENEVEGGKEISLCGLNILVTEDNACNREIAIEILTEFGATVDTAENGLIAVEKIQNSNSGQYDLILMDVQMPVMNGYEATRRIRALTDPAKASIPIIAMTANAFEEDRKAAFESGMNEHVPKPIDALKLIEVLNEWK